MSSPGSVTGWALALRSPDPATRREAAEAIWRRWAPRLLELARRELDARIRRREDEEDVLQSMYRSFCRRQGPNAPPLGCRDDLWGLLVRATMWKVINAGQRHRAARRDIRREVAGRPPAAGGDDASGEAVGERVDRDGRRNRFEPTPAEAVDFNEALQRRLAELPEDLRRVALLKLEGYTHPEIGELIGRTERTVEMKVRRIRRRWEEQQTVPSDEGRGD